MIDLIRPYSNFYAWVLLVLMLVVLLPKELFHHHSEAEASHSVAYDYQLDLAVSADDDCPICDFQLLPLPAVVDEAPAKSTVVYEVHYTTTLFNTAKAPFRSFSGRAPPII